MPVRIKKIKKGKYRVSTPNGVKAKGTTKEKAEAQARLLQGVEHGWKPTKQKMKKHGKGNPHFNESYDYRGPGYMNPNVV